MIFPFVLEAMLLLTDTNLSILEIDQTMRCFGFKMGPFEMLDLSGLDIGFNIRKERGLIAIDKNTLDRYNNNIHVESDLLELEKVSDINEVPRKLRQYDRYSNIGDILYKLGRQGVKNRLGFYRYEEELDKKHLVAFEDPIVSQIIHNTRLKYNKLESLSSMNQSKEKQRDNVLNRLICVLANEGFKVLEDGGLESNRPGDIDLIFIHGYSWPRLKGGPMFYAERKIGLASLLTHLYYFCEIMPYASWLKPSSLLVKMVAQHISLSQLQSDTELIHKLCNKL
jgi:3-hydroxyacyl-CoA dehydrogenase